MSLAHEPSVAFFALALAAVILSAYAVRTAVVGRKIHPRVAREGGTLLLGPWAMDAFHWFMRGIAAALLRTSVQPDTLTWISLAMSSLSAPLAATGHFALAGLLLLFGASFDAFDGIVARERRLASDAGEVLDAVIDRYADAAPLIGLAMFYRGSLWQMAIPLCALIGSLMVSYVRAKAEAMRIDLPPGMMRRHERIAYIAAGLIISPLCASYTDAISGVDQTVALALVTLVAVLANVSAARSAALTRSLLIAAGRGPRGMA